MRRAQHATCARANPVEDTIHAAGVLRVEGFEGRDYPERAHARRLQSSTSKQKNVGVRAWPLFIPTWPGPRSSCQTRSAQEDSRGKDIGGGQGEGDLGQTPKSMLVITLFSHRLFEPPAQGLHRTIVECKERHGDGWVTRSITLHRTRSVVS